jgi:hypothetical protein
MKNKKKVYVYSETRDYMIKGVYRSIHERGACKRNRRRFRKISLPLTVMQQLDTET